MDFECISMIFTLVRMVKRGLYYAGKFALNDFAGTQPSSAV